MLKRLWQVSFCILAISISGTAFAALTKSNYAAIESQYKREATNFAVYEMCQVSTVEYLQALDAHTLALGATPAQLQKFKGLMQSSIPAAKAKVQSFKNCQPAVKKNLTNALKAGTSILRQSTVVLQKSVKKPAAVKRT